jgi:transcription elongation factor GreA
MKPGRPQGCPGGFKEQGKMSQSVPMTKESFEALQEELKRLIREERPKVILDIAEARGHGDLSENAEYDAAKNRQGFIEGKIQELKDKLARAYVVDLSNLKPDKVVFGATVTLYDTATEEEVTFRIVGEDEADIKLGKLSCTSPVGRALIGHRLDDTVRAKVPAGVKEYEIIDIQYA